MKELSENEFETKTGQGTVLIDFSAEWCGPCKAMVPVLGRMSEQYAERLEIFSVDIDKSPALAMRHGVMSVPTLLLFREGKAVERIVGAVSEKELKKTLDRHVGAASAR
jgi:thioredoxin 1